MRRWSEMVDNFKIKMYLREKFHNMIKRLLSILIISATSVCAHAFSIEALRFHCADDTVKINQMLHDAITNQSLKTQGQYMSFFADKLMGTPYVAHTLEGDREYLTINVDQLDCTTFVETLVALTKAAVAKSPSWYSYASQLENIRYHSGHINGYASRLHYISAWVIENANRGNFREITGQIPSSEAVVKSLNFMSTHRDSYPALADSTAYAEIKNLEAGYNSHRFSIINKRNLYKKDVINELRDGDIICLTTKTDGLDVSHLGIVRFVKGKPHLLHASSNAKKVIIDKDDLFEMLKPLRSNTGIRVIRLTDEIY